MAETEEDPIVVFELPDGTEVSNDPRWHARRTLAAEGVDVDAMQAKIAELQAQIEAANAAKDEDIEDTDEDAAGDYADVKGKDLVNLAKERNIELTVEGKKLTAGQVREALRAQDAAK